MYGNGVVIGMEAMVAVHKPILQVLQVAPAVCCAEVDGSAAQGTAECRFGAATTTMSVGSTTAGSDFAYQNNIVIYG